METPKILELNGFKYSKEQFDDYEIRAMVKLKTVDKEHIVTIYTTNTSKEEFWQVMADRRHESVVSIGIDHWATKEQDELVSKFIDEWLTEPEPEPAMGYCHYCNLREDVPCSNVDMAKRCHNKISSL